jgi:hypothetical protein
MIIKLFRLMSLPIWSHEKMMKKILLLSTLIGFRNDLPLDILPQCINQ